MLKFWVSNDAVSWLVKCKAADQLLSDREVD